MRNDIGIMTKITELYYFNAVKYSLMVYGDT